MLDFNLLPKQEHEPRPEEIGKNIDIRLIFIRHGEKDPQNREAGLLTERGKQQFREFAERELQDPERNLICYGTEIPRTVQSSLEALKSSKASVKVYPEPLDEIDMHIDKTNDKNRKTRFSRKFLEEMKGMPQDDNVKRYLSYGDKRPDEETYSPREFAGGLAKVILKFDNKADRLKNKNKSDVLMVSHDFMLSTFLTEVLHEESVDGLPTLKTAEFFEVSIKTNENGEHSLDCVHRGKHYKLDMEMLKKLAQIYEEAENKT